MIDFRAALQALHGGGVKFILVGGAAATEHGSARLTQDLDVVYERSLENLERLAIALAPHGPYLRGAPPGLPFCLDARTLAHGLNFTLTTAFGDLDFEAIAELETILIEQENLAGADSKRPPRAREEARHD